MSELINLTPLFPLQRGLDEEIASIHGISYESTKKERLLALLVEFGEFANETRCFKYWSNKPSSEKAVVLDEYADGLHFFLSNAIALGIEELAYLPSLPKKSKTEAILDVYAATIRLHEERNADNCLKAFKLYLDLIPLFGFSNEDAINAYLAKMKVNHIRQETNY